MECWRRWGEGGLTTGSIRSRNSWRSDCPPCLSEAVAAQAG